MQKQKDKQKRSTQTTNALASLEVETGATRLRYSLHRHRGAGVRGGPGWVERAVSGELAGAVRRVSACEAYLMAERCGREGEVARATEALAARLSTLDPRRGHEQAARLRRELGAGRAGDRVALDALQQATLRAMARGTSLSLLAERAGMRLAGGRADVTGLERALGLAPSAAGTWARTLAYADGVSLARALDLDPVEAGV
jgi:hypothetical protein